MFEVPASFAAKLKRQILPGPSASEHTHTLATRGLNSGPIFLSFGTSAPNFFDRSYFVRRGTI
jgi:hypothetical protein